ncbi:hypothetical protein BUL40_14805 [Croceivirga radicis]|uniref:histidine kinase n=1 Tax=Croceivirga radicis TaxID=1929488 RepID=A0A1V6LN62_9FLAO|nr:PAS domain-containing protein [Croceivirga radicis]OQD41640.1 hypothetical protein BUL40_14805 [Croceivirga radicis]
MALINSQGKLVEATDEWVRYHGFQFDNINGQSICSLLKQYADNDWKQVVAEGLSGISKQGITRGPNNSFFKWSFSPWFDENQNTIGTIHKVDDVTQKTLNDIKYDKLDNLLNLQSEISKVGFWEFDIDNYAISWSQTAKEIFEVGPEFEPTVKNTLEFYRNSKEKEIVKMLFRNSSEIGITWHEKLRIISAKGNKKHLNVACRPIYSHGKIIKLVGTLQDITEQVNSKVTIEENENLLNTLIDSLPASVFIKDTESRKILVNKQEEEFIGLPKQEIIGKNDFELFDAEIAKTFREEDLRVLSTGVPILGKRTITKLKSGKELALLTSKIPFENIKGEIKGIIGISLDISDVIQKERELKQLIQVTTVQNNKLIDFAHIVSHNIRSHSANITMLLNFLNMEEDPIETKNLLGMLGESASDLAETLEHLNQVLVINQQLKLDREIVNLHDLTNKAATHLKDQLDLSQARLNNQVSENLYLKTVPIYLENILIQFISNAIKYRRPNTTPQIRVYTTRENGKIVIHVEDNGLGLNLNQHKDKLFGMYKTFHNNAEAKGIGLFIARNQAEAMGAKLEVKSKVNKGSTFSIIIGHEK